MQAVQLFAPYGTVRYADQIMPTDYSFTGQRLDSMTGLLYYNARYYDPVGGQFTSADTVQNNTTGLDPYAYAADNPETRIDPTGHRFMLAGGGGGSPGVDDPTGLGQFFSDIQDYLDSQNPFVSGVEVTAAVVTAPIWVPIVLVGLLLSIPSDSSQSNQSQNTSASPSPEATPATNTDGAGARCCNFRRPNDRQFFSKIKQKTSAHSDKNTVIMPWVDVNADVAAINSGNVTPVKGIYTVNGRSYAVHDNGTLYPTTGDGFVTLNRAEYNALGVYNSFGDTALASMRSIALMLKLKYIRTERLK